MLFTTDDHVPRSFAAGLENIQAKLKGLRLCQMLDKLSRHLDKLPAADTLPDADPPFDVEDVEDVLEEEDEEEEDYKSYDDDDDEIWSPKSPEQAERKNGFGPAEISLTASQTKKSQILADLRRVKGAGFKVGIIGPLVRAGSSGYLCISIRVSKLGISDEALQAWSVDRRRYLVLLIYYPQGYRDITQMSQDDKVGNSGVEMRVGLCHSYKPSRSAAVQAFTKTVKSATSSIVPTEYKPEDIKEEDKFHLMFLSQSLRGLLNERLFKILRYRLSMAFGWGGAELFYNDHQCKALDQRELLNDKYYEEDNVQSSMSLLEVVMADHLVEARDQASFPLVAMQFVLRHFVRCTEFCLVCHCKVKADFEALKPYVCDNGLCLYQYMSLGFGPSIEWEIMSQPYVVDLLISFCYASARDGRLKDFPSGLDLQVPPILSTSEPPPAPEPYHLPGHATPTHTAPGKSGLLLWEPTRQNARFDPKKFELIFSNANEKSPVKDGDWIVIQDPLHVTREFHCRVTESALFPTVKVGHLNFRGLGSADSLGVVSDPSLQSIGGSRWTEIWFNKYSVHFDELSVVDKRRSICQILDTLPDVRQMKEYLLHSQRHRSEPSLSHWNQRISPTALNLLRWVIASNRSCLLQVDDMDGTEKDSRQINALTPEDRVHGMGQWMQFRFAQGAPDKEQRFVNAVKLTTERLSLQYPTIFAWHGSPLGNWHGIVREGLHYKETLHGRAFGHGVYMSNHFGTSSAYSNMGYNTSSAHPWPHSKLKITSALALNEVVNAPAEYTHSSPHYVVQHVDWIQTRYLFVQCKASDRPLTAEKQPQRVFPQDPKRVVNGENGSAIVIPITAVSKCRRSTTSPRSSHSGSKRVKIEIETDEEQAQREEDDRHSVATNMSDLEVFFATDDEDDELREIPKKEFERCTQSSHKLPPQTDFVEQSLDITTLPMLAPPSYATTVATKALQRALRETLAAQESTPLHELGWYVNSDHINNMYQWIVELHSFDPKLPLSIDMKAKDIKSIVLELRFTSNFPYAPPFVRVIRPRFLPFLQGGGGHVTAGGALCMELLTSSGWSAVNNIESVLLQVRMAISSTEPKPARLDTHGRHDYGIGEAVDAYVRACNLHNWKIPDGFMTFNQEGASSSGAYGISGSRLAASGGLV
jgi:ubiquitin-conjugating enzyme E2 Q